MLPSLAITLTRTLADDPRNQLEFWLEEAATAARGMCSEHDFSGALTLAATDRVWAAYPGNVTNFVDVIANGDAPQIRARPTWALPNALDAAASAAEVVIWRQPGYGPQPRLQCGWYPPLCSPIGQYWRSQQDTPPKCLAWHRSVRPPSAPSD